MYWLIIKGKQISDKYIQDEITVYAAQASFFTVLAVFPFLMLLLTLIQVIPGITKADLLATLVALMPDMFDSMVVKIVDDLYTRSPGTILSVTAITALWSSSKGMLSIERGLNRVYETPQKRNYILRRLICSGYTVLFMFVCALSLLLLVFGDTLQNFILHVFPIIGKAITYLISFRNLLALIIFLFFFVGLYTIVPKKKQDPWQQLPGAIFSTVGWMIFSYLFSLYFKFFKSYSYMYGSLTAIVLLMLWLYISICILFLGAEINYYLYNSHSNNGVDR